MAARVSPSMTADEIAAPGRFVGPSVGDVEVVGDPEAGPAGLDDEGVADVTLGKRDPRRFGSHDERSCDRPAEQLGEQRRRVGAGMAEPRHAHRV